MTQTPEQIAIDTRKAYDESLAIVGAAAEHAVGFLDNLADDEDEAPVGRRIPAPLDGAAAPLVAWYMTTDAYEADVAWRVDQAIADEAEGVAERRRELAE